VDGLEVVDAAVMVSMMVDGRWSMVDGRSTMVECYSSCMPRAQQRKPNLKSIASPSIIILLATMGFWRHKKRGNLV